MNLLESINGIGISIDELDSFSATEFEDRVRNDLFTANEYGKNAKKVQDRIINFYIKRDDKKVKNNLFYIKKYSDLQTHVAFFIPMIMEIEAKQESNWPLYVYENNYHDEHHLPDHYKIKVKTVL